MNGQLFQSDPQVGEQIAAGRCAVRSALARATMVLALSALSVLAGCALPVADPIPGAITTPPAGDLQLIETQVDPKAHTGKRVRWGGNVIQVNRDAAGTASIQVIERRLDAEGRPIEGSVSDGRFMIKAAAGVDPQFYSRDRLITVAGTIDGAVTAHTGASEKTMPLVRVSEFMLWLPQWRHDPYWRHDDRWYGPRIHFGVGASNYRYHHRNHHRYGGRHNYRYH